ncbi:MAG: hypothetical protein ACMXYC_02765 [Candidatus Woesearchaeota archaeon]
MDDLPEFSVKDLAVEKQEKKGWFSSLFGKKKAVDTSTSEQKQVKFSDISVSDDEVQSAQRRYAEQLDMHKRQYDHQMRERQQFVVDKEKELQQKEQEVEQVKKTVTKKEKELDIKASYVDQVTAMQREIEDQTITLSQQQEALEQLRKNMEKKFADLKSYEYDLAQKEKRIKEQHERIASLQAEKKAAEQKAKEEHKKLIQTQKLEDDALIYVTDEMERQQKEFEHELGLVKKRMERYKEIHDHPTKKNVSVLLQMAQKALEHDVVRAKQLYTQARALYKQYRLEHKDDVDLYNALLSLYDKIAKKERL